MLETGLRQFRMATGMVFGRRLDPANVADLVDDAIATITEFGTPGLGARELIDGPFADPEARLDLADRGIRRTVRRLAKVSPFYARRLAAAGLAPDHVTADSLRAIPPTLKSDLVGHSQEFLCRDAKPLLATRTTSTTGHAAEVWISRYELDLWAGLSALNGVIRDEIRRDDVLHVHVSSRATASVQLTTAVCRLVGAACRVLGVIPADEALDNLVGTATLMSSSPSYLGELVLAARRRGLSNADFRLRRIDVGGEILSPTVRAAAADMFGCRINDAFGMTEVIPVSASTCSHGHLHHDLSMGFVELLDLITGEPAAPGQLSTIVITPYYPFRECMPVLRYDTRDAVRTLTGQPLTCEVAGLPATTQIVGKADQLIHRGPNDVVTPRDLVEAIEALPTEPWPARYATAIVDGQLQLALPRSATLGMSRQTARSHFHERGLDVNLLCVPDDQARELRRVRSDLHETTFTQNTGTIGAHHART